MKRIIFLMLLILSVTCQTAFGASELDAYYIWVNPVSTDLLTASKVVVYPIENADSDVKTDTITLQLGKAAIPQAVWSIAPSRSVGRSGEELAAEINGAADLIIVPEVIQQYYKEGHSDRIEQYIDIHNREEVEFRGSRHVKYDIHYPEKVTVPECSERLDILSVSYLIYDRSGQLIMAAILPRFSNKGLQDAYKDNISTFYKSSLPMGLKLVRNKGKE